MLESTKAVMAIAMERIGPTAGRVNPTRDPATSPPIPAGVKYAVVRSGVAPRNCSATVKVDDEIY